ncbi:MAG: hypothetical protein EOP48_00120 [Sphingobacteriales bacterium]|nr:MAG: hypothetical protein EOP48_00120 [Sphingobacteriales bacterium]
MKTVFAFFVYMALLESLLGCSDTPGKVAPTIQSGTNSSRDSGGTSNISQGSNSTTSKKLLIQSKDIQHYSFQPKDARKVIAGFSSSGLLLSPNVLSPSWLVAKSLTKVNGHSLLLIEFDENVDRSLSGQKLVVDTGYDVFKECGALVVYNTKTQLTDCFDNKLGTYESNVRYVPLQKELNIDGSIVALKIIPTASGKLYQQVRRFPDGKISTLIETPTVEGEEYQGQTAGGILTKFTNTLDQYAAPKWNAQFSVNGIVIKKSLNLSLLLFQESGCFFYFSSDGRQVLKSCSQTSQPLVDELVCNLLSGPRDVLVSQISPMTYLGKSHGTHRLIGEAGVELWVDSLNKLCTTDIMMRNYKISNATVFGNLSMYILIPEGIAGVFGKREKIKAMLSDHKITDVEIQDNEDTIFFTGVDSNDHLVSGTAITSEGVVMKNPFNL